MKTSFEQLEEVLNAELHPQAQCHVVFLYEDYESGWHAMQLYQHIVESICIEAVADWTRWRFGELTNPEAREAAVESLQTADLVIIAASDSTDLSVEAQAALETGLSLDRASERTMVALLGNRKGATPFSSPLYFYLKDIASRDGFNFYAGTYSLPEAEAYSAESIRRRAETEGAVLSGILNRQIPFHWGINE